MNEQTLVKLIPQPSGTIVFDIQNLLPTGNKPFIVNGRKYLFLSHAASSGRTVGVSEHGVNTYAEPIWSQEITDGPIRLDIITSKVVVLDSSTKPWPMPLQLINVLFAVGEASPENPEEIEVQELPFHWRVLFKELFPSEEWLSILSKFAFHELNMCRLRGPLFAVPNTTNRTTFKLTIT